MNTSLRRSLALIAAAIVGAALFLGSMAFARFGWGRENYAPTGTMRWYGPTTYRQPGTGSAPYGSGMMGRMIGGPLLCTTLPAVFAAAYLFGTGGLKPAAGQPSSSAGGGRAGDGGLSP
jgi:hypothetical protein